jgi:hypothetical protein
MWKLLAGGISFEDIIDQLVLQYANDRDLLASDLPGFIPLLTMLGILKEKRRRHEKTAIQVASVIRISYTSPKVHIYGQESDERPGLPVIVDCRFRSQAAIW